MPTVTPAQIAALQANTKNIRNICILAHVDHGKTTLSDSLLASNGIISPKMSGKVRYLDSREDEQQRGITMKSSGISLVCKGVAPSSGLVEDHLVNLVDSPGHVDFYSEVSTASRLCDGALVLIDSVEGVCTQTHTVLRQAWRESVRPILVLNKMDRLITELKLTPLEAYTHLARILEQVNAIVGTFHEGDILEEDARRYEEWRHIKRKVADHIMAWLNRTRPISAFQAKRQGSKEADDESDHDWQVERRDDSDLFFSPEQENVIFSSAIDGWAFRIQDFAKIYSAKLSMKEDVLRRVLWGEFYLDPKMKRVLGPKGVKGRSLRPMFVQFILENLWAVYDAVLVGTDREKVEKITKALSVKILPRDLRSKDTKALLSTIMIQWLPLSTAVLDTVVSVLPSPREAQKIRIPKILNQHAGSTSSPTTATTHTTPSDLERALLECDPSDDVPVVAFVSKMFSVPVEDLPGKRRVQLSAEEMRERRKLVVQRIAERKAAEALATTADAQAIPLSAPSPLEPSSPSSLVSTSTVPTFSDEASSVLEKDSDDAPPPEALVGFARVYSGTLRPNQTVHVLGPKYDPRDPTKHHSVVTITRLFLLMGRDLEELNFVPAGNVCGIAGLEGFIVKSGTLAGTEELKLVPHLSTTKPPPFTAQMSQLADGLRMLNHSDPCVEVFLQQTGEWVVVCAGELHLERCLKDLRERYAKIDIQVSPPIVPFRETISSVPAIASAAQGQTTLTTPNKLCTVRIRAVPLPAQVVTFLNAASADLRAAVEGRTSESDTEGAESWDSVLKGFRGAFEKAFEAEEAIGGPEAWLGVVDRLWSLGPNRVGPNMLVNNIEGYSRISFCHCFLWEADVDANDDVATRRVLTVRDYDGSIATGFQLATSAGPLCAEPMMGVCFSVEDFRVHVGAETDAAKLSALSGQIITTVRDACRQAFLTWSPRLMLATYSCDLQAPSEVLGRVYGVLARRRGRILSEEMKEGTPFFNIRSVLPVVESFGFADDIRKKTSGAASPQLIFHGFEVLDQDPFWVPTTEEELEDLGEKADRENLAKKYMEGVRKRKGMFVEKKIVEHAEKQRTLKSK
ncbi:P-loop containing nucleoside triphosphate hydrolase protein [Blyttiomyces helicus]|uniref:Elongation factor-like 1 n=1 Tax=Blyttiomyces helicus TaxID=388810 RepID=A0A4V1ISE4_9FUNG|nr:P-loop containing nucleoside triphosphate hydrolase protein [Blyttiomyces helicus]|eukprot:RKO93267.1 P-loop containing nucleoside triphosphate hydrolase protein [Blyttiomyces helicus]